MLTEGADKEALARGAFDTFQSSNLRYSQMAPLTMWEETNTGTNLPAEIKLEAIDGAAYHFMFMTKGGGSANKSYLFQETKALLNPTEPAGLPRREASPARDVGLPARTTWVSSSAARRPSWRWRRPSWLRPAISTPSPPSGSASGHGFRDLEMEAEVLELTRQFGIGAQFGGKYFCHDVRVIRLPRHGASLPVGVAVSCSADRQALAKITADGVFLEQPRDRPGPVPAGGDRR